MISFLADSLTLQQRKGPRTQAEDQTDLGNAIGSGFLMTVLLVGFIFYWDSVNNYCCIKENEYGIFS